MDTVGQLAQAAPLSAPFTPTEPASSEPPSSEPPSSQPPSSQVFVDASGRRARRLTRCGYLLGMGCLGYIGMVALGLSGTRVAALPGVPTSAENEIIAGLSGESGSIGLHLTRAPVVSVPRPAQSRVGEAHAAAVRSAAAHNATLNAHAALARPKEPVPVTGRPVTQAPRSYGTEQILAEGGTSGAAADVADGSETRSEEKAEQKAAEKADKTSKTDSKRSGHGSDDESY